MEYRDFSRRIHDRAAVHEGVIKAQLELTYRCNLHCRHCYTDPYNSNEWFPRELSCAEILRLIDEMAEHGIVWLNLTGGEIFQHQHFWDIYDHAYRRGFLLQLYTNGTLFTRGIIERLQHAPPFTIDISCHSVRRGAFRLVHASPRFLPCVHARTGTIESRWSAIHLEDQSHELE